MQSILHQIVNCHDINEIQHSLYQQSQSTSLAQKERIHVHLAVYTLQRDLLQQSSTKHVRMLQESEASLYLNMPLKILYPFHKLYIHRPQSLKNMFPVHVLELDGALEGVVYEVVLVRLNS